MPSLQQRSSWLVPWNTTFRFLLSTLSAAAGVVILESSFEPSSAMLCALAVIPAILIIYDIVAFMVMLAVPLRQMVDLLRIIAQHVAFGVFTSISFDFLGMHCPDSPVFQEISIRLRAVTFCVWMYNANTIHEIVSRGSLTSIIELWRLIRQHPTSRILVSILSAVAGVVISDSSFDPSSAMFCTLAVIPAILIIYAITAFMVMPDFPLRRMVDHVRIIAQHVAFGVFTSISFDFLGMYCPDSPAFQEISVRLWAVAICICMYNANTVLEIVPRVSLTPIVELWSSIPRCEYFADIIKDLTFAVEKWYPNASPLKENSARTWTFWISERIYRRTGDVISGSLASTTLVTFLISRDEMPTYVFLIWGACLVAYMRINRAAVAAT